MATLNINDTTEQPTTPPQQPTDHPLYQNVETLINQGNWRAAQVPLAKLLTLYPDDTYLQELMASARARSALLGLAQEATPAPARGSALTRSLKFIIPAFILIAVLGLAAGIFLVLQLWILPRISSQRLEAQISQLRQESQAALASGDYDRAVLAYNELLKLLPDDRQALKGLEQASQLRLLISLYSEAIAEMEAHHWENALSILQQIEAEQPGYRDVAERINFIQEQQILSDRFSEAEAAFNQGNYELAIQKYEALQAIDYSFQSKTVQDHLFLSYLQLGLAEEAAAGSDPERLQAAFDKFEKALTLRPDDEQVKGERQLLRLYLNSLNAFETENWSQVISDLTPIYEARHDFAGGNVGQLLYEAYLALGDELFADGQIEQALVKYEAARLIKGADTSGLNQKIALAKEALATPTPEPTAATAPVTAPVIANSAPASAPAPTPTATPMPLPYTLKNMSVRNNCSGVGYIHGVVWSTYNMPMAGVTVEAFNTTTGLGPLTANPTNGDGIYQIILNGGQIEGLWVVQVLENGQPASKPWGQHLGGECVNGAQELKVDWQRALEIQ